MSGCPFCRYLGPGERMVSDIFRKSQASDPTDPTGIADLGLQTQSIAEQPVCPARIKSV